MTRSSLSVERTILRLLHGQKTRTHLAQIHAHFLRHNLDQSNQIVAHFVSVCGSFSKMNYANRVFSLLQNPNILPFNSMIKGYSLCGPFEKSFLLFSDMKNRGILPDEYTFAPLIKACSNLCDEKVGQCVYGQVLRGGLECYGSIGIGVVEFYVSCGMMESAQKMFDEMPRRDVIVWNLMIRGFCKIGNVNMGLYLFRQMTERSIVSWNSVISCLVQSGRDAKALELFHEMRYQGFEPDDVTIVTMLPVCSRLGALDVGQSIHTYANAKKLGEDVISVGNALVDFYCKCGNMEMAFKNFNKMICKNVVSWNSMISGLAFNGKGELGIEFFEEMMRENVVPNDATFVGVLTACAHLGMVEKGKDLFSSMSIKYKIEPKLEHYGCMVDLLGRSGRVKEAYEFVKTMPVEPNGAIWGSLLSACRTHGYAELSELAVKELIDIEPWNSGNYVLLSNMFAERGKWDEVEKVRVLMREKSIKKSPGLSEIVDIH